MNDLNAKINKKPILSIVVPCYNEEDILSKTTKCLSEKLSNLIKLSKINEKSFIVFVDDGSKDKTWEVITDFILHNSNIKGVKLSKNYGHQNALMAGMNFVKNKCDCLITIDADLQQDIDAVDLFIEKYLEGNEVVYGVRKDRKNDSLFKKITANLFYGFMSFMGVDIIKNHADFRLFSKRANNSVLMYKETNIFLRSIVPLIGFKSEKVYFKVSKRDAGVTKYTSKRMFIFAIDAITSFSIIPLRIITFVGLLVSLFSIIMIFYNLCVVLFTNKSVHGWASTVLPIYFIGGVQLLSLGIIGEYIGKIYKETKKRPLYFIDKVLDFTSKDEQ